MNSIAHPHGSGRESGFTLIELLVSLTLLSVILGLLAGAIGVFSKNWDVNTQRIETLDMVARASDILRRDAAGMQRIAVVKERAPHYVFTGTDTTLSFITLEPPYPSAAGPYFIQYSVAPNGKNTELIRARARYQRGMEAFPGATEANRVRLVQGRYRYHFAYADKSAGAGQWRTSWTSANRLPQLIRLQIFDVQKDVPLAPPLVVALRADAELGCLSQKPAACSAKSNGALTGQSATAQDRGDGSSNANGMSEGQK